MYFFIATDYYIVLPATDLCGLTAGKFDKYTEFRGRGVTFVHMEVRSVAGVRLLSIASRVDCIYVGTLYRY